MAAAFDIEKTPEEKAVAESRRKFLKTAAITTAGSVLLPRFLQAFPADRSTKIAIIGAGIAGLNAAYQLHKMGLKATVYEASGRVGGRMFSIKDKFGKGITTDIGGEYIDTDHQEIIDLVKELNLEFYDLRKDELEPQTFYFEGRFITENELTEAIKPFAKNIEADIQSLPEIINYKNAEDFQHLDDLSITEYLIKLGIKGWLYNFLNLVLTREYGMEASEQSAINFLIMFIEPDGNKTSYELFGEAHEVLKIKGGSQQLTNQLYAQIKPQVLIQHKLTSIQKNGKKYSLDFLEKGRIKNVLADYVIIAIPFTLLRLIKMDVPMPAEKKKCIAELGYGNSGKFIIGVHKKPWREKGQRGYLFTDLPFGCAWDSSLMQSETEGGYTVFGGGNFMQMPCNEANGKVLKTFTSQIAEIYTDIQEASTGKTLNFCWEKYPYSLAGYSSFKKGQWSTIAGWEAEPIGNIYFAGEHTSLTFQGYMNGAALTGRLAAEKIAEILKIKN